MKIILVAVGGASGALVRYWAGIALHSALGPRLPWGTFVVNITGSFLVGFVMTILGTQISVSPNWRILIVTGFLGAYTTFSALEYETLALIENQRGPTALLYVILSLIVGLAAVWLGCVAAQHTPISPDLTSRIQTALTERINRATQL
jgi:fluoride exporter